MYALISVSKDVAAHLIFCVTLGIAHLSIS